LSWKKDRVAEKVPQVFQMMCCAFSFVYKLGGLEERLLWTLHLTLAQGKPFGFWLVLAVFLPCHMEVLSPRVRLGKRNLESRNPQLGQSGFSLVFLK